MLGEQHDPCRNDSVSSDVETMVHAFSLDRLVGAEGFTPKGPDRLVYSPHCTRKWNRAAGCRLNEAGPGGRKFRCRDCQLKRYGPLPPWRISQHLEEGKPIGAYPLMPDSKAPWVAADFDLKHAGVSDVMALRWKACEIVRSVARMGIPLYTEVSQSGKGIHFWLFCAEPHEAWKLRALMARILRDAGVLDAESGFDLLFPNQDKHGGAGFVGNLIALPLRGWKIPLGRTVFLDPYSAGPEPPIGEVPWVQTVCIDPTSPYPKPYIQQFTLLRGLERITPGAVDDLVQKWSLVPLGSGKRALAGGASRALRRNPETAAKTRVPATGAHRAYLGPLPRPDDLPVILQCDFFSAFTRAQVGDRMREPLWFVVLQLVAATCVGFDEATVESARKTAEELSALSADHCPASFEEKWQHARESVFMRGFPTCRRIADEGYACPRLGHSCAVGSPAKLPLVGRVPDHIDLQRVLQEAWRLKLLVSGQRGVDTVMQSMAGRGVFERARRLPVRYATAGRETIIQFLSGLAPTVPPAALARLVDGELTRR